MAPGRINDQIKDQGSRIKDQGSRFKDQESRIKDQETRFKDQGSRIRKQGSRIKDRIGSRHKDQGSWTLFVTSEHPRRATDVILRQSKAPLEIFNSRLVL